MARAYHGRPHAYLCCPAVVQACCVLQLGQYAASRREHTKRPPCATLVTRPQAACNTVINSVVCNHIAHRGKLIAEHYGKRLEQGTYIMKKNKIVWVRFSYMRKMHILPIIGHPEPNLRSDKPWWVNLFDEA